jgi:hypothetical protein
MKSLRPLISILCLAFFVAGCATGPDFSKYSVSIPPTASGQGQVWFYRPSKMLGSAVQPHVFLNGENVGKAQPGCYFYVDRPPGEYEAKCSTEWSDTGKFTLAAGDEKYVRLTLGIGLFVGHIIPKEVDRATGLREIANCRLITADGMNANWQTNNVQ